MDFNFGWSRQRATQETLMFIRTAPVAPAAVTLSDDLNSTRLVTSFLVNNKSTAPAPVYLSTSKGMRANIEIVPGGAPFFVAFQETRPLYELQVLLFKQTGQQAQDLVKIPVIVWDMTTWYLQAGGSTPIDVTVSAFVLPYL